MDREASRSTGDQPAQGSGNGNRGCVTSRTEAGRGGGVGKEFQLDAENARRPRPKEEDALREEEINRLGPRVVSLTMDLDPGGRPRQLKRPTPIV
jgi:hypothetical protein